MRPTDFFNRQIAFHREFVKFTGSVTAALLLSQALYWSKKTDYRPFYKTIEEWSEETGMSRAEIDTARKKLREIGVLEERYDRLTHRMFYRVNRDHLDALIESCVPESLNQAVGSDGIQQSFNNAEITTEIPPSPHGGEEEENLFPLPSPKESRAQREQARLGAIFRRRPDTKFSKSEAKAWRDITPISEEDFELIERYYSAKINPDLDYRRTTLSVLLNNWNGEVDKARKYKPSTCF